MANSYFFSHDLDARNDEKITEMRAEFGAEGYGIFWMLVEMLAQAEGYQLSLDRINGIAYSLNIEQEKLRQFIDRCSKKPINLFKQESGYFFSISLKKRMNYRDEIIEKRRKAGIISGKVRKQKINTVETSVEQVLNKKEQTKLNETKQHYTTLNKTTISKEIAKQALEILAYLNEKCNKHYKDTRFIKARLKDGGTIEECKQIIDTKLHDPHFIENPHLMRSETLFCKTHWDSYVNQKPEDFNKPKSRHPDRFIGAKEGEDLGIPEHAKYDPFWKPKS